MATSSDEYHGRVNREGEQNGFKDQDPDSKYTFLANATQTSIKPDQLDRERETDGDASVEELTSLEKRLVRKIDWRLCTIAGILCSLNLLDSGIISSASVTSIFEDLGLGEGDRYSVSILVYTVASVTFQLPATLLVRALGPRVMFGCITVAFGIITMVREKVFWRRDAD